MEKIERPILRADKSAEQSEMSAPRGIPLGELVARENIEIDKSTADILKIALEQNKHLSHVEIIFVSPKEVPYTGGLFHRVQVDEQTFIPTISIVAENEKHMQKLKDTRQASAKKAAEMLGINFFDLTPRLLRQFIIAHELGHADDYVINYETNPDYTGAGAVKEWNLHYRSNLLTLPVPGWSPRALREEILQYNDLSSFLEAYPDTKKKINTNEIKTLQDLLNAQELAYRASEYERCADDFAANFLKKNAKELGIRELIRNEKIKKAA
jgi:hypothetical protein